MCYTILVKCASIDSIPDQWRCRLVGRGRMIGNHVNVKAFREFESLHLRQETPAERQDFLSEMYLKEKP